MFLTHHKPTPQLLVRVGVLAILHNGVCNGIWVGDSGDQELNVDICLLWIVMIAKKRITLSTP